MHSQHETRDARNLCRRHERIALRSFYFFRILAGRRVGAFQYLLC